MHLCAPTAPIPWDEIVPLCTTVENPSLTPLLPAARRPRSALAVTVVIPAHRGPPVGLARFLQQDVNVTPLILANGPFAQGLRVDWLGHGATRNLALPHIQTPWVCFSVDDAIPLGPGFLQALIERLEETGADAVTARQIPWPTADHVTRTRIRAWTPPNATSSPPLDNVAALYRTNALLDDPFDDVPTAEDWLWGRRHRVAYAPNAVVVHSHPRVFTDLFTRTRDTHRVRIAEGEAPRVPSLTAMLRGLPSTIGPDLPGALAELLGQYAATYPRKISQTHPSA